MLVCLHHWLKQFIIKFLNLLEITKIMHRFWNVFHILIQSAEVWFKGIDALRAQHCTAILHAALFPPRQLHEILIANTAGDVALNQCRSKMLIRF